ncbi:tRNA(Ile)-lysidine synthetase [Acidimicrobium ferrooxidans DSM 10331]|uniref:tRNA(Ile)-lysidine synthase n=1 Tax=Acidimicrobium ferrooxidans (strain DSM 10331 / JCM 15462 / NBRC 103882 / ICP) TaxID=525909 RepID=C7M1S2_ACIFD|nr:tRNA lysidine(34) synthetase [Acidimicrobium ferrooxidans]ACU54819.1 tRNA(Ile)-lysidine synthetase [Acidimicrobium ferrooxidans DSM 10331]
MRPSPSWVEAAQRRARELGIDLASLGERLWPLDDDPVRVGVSGGADSLGLAALLAFGGKRVLAIHVDHGLRPGSAREGADVARQLAPLGISVLERRVRVIPGPNLEARARSARLGALGDAARAHTMDDQAETVLLNLLRGSGLVGIGAMEPGPLHPALGLRRSELARVCEAAGLVPLVDPMNQDVRFRRVRVRTELLPLAAAIAERDVVPLLARAAAHAREAVRLQARYPELAPATTQLATWVRHQTGLRLSAAHRRALVQVADGTRRAHALPSDLDVRRVGSSLVLSSGGREIARLGLESEGRRP